MYVSYGLYRKEISLDTNIETSILDDPAEILYGDKKKEEEEKEEERKKLLEQLGDKLSPAEIFYSSNKELAKKRDLLFEDESSKKDENFTNIRNVKLYDKISKNNDKTKITDQNGVLRGRIIYDEDENGYLNEDYFKRIMKHVYDSEGGFVDNPYDRGGRTNKGITQKTFDNYNKENKLPYKDVKNITQDESDKIYKEKYWIASGANKINDKYLAYLHFDTAINHGVGVADRILKESGGDFDKYCNARRDIYTRLSKKPNQQRFYKGWMNRIDKINRIKQNGLLD